MTELVIDGAFALLDEPPPGGRFAEASVLVQGRRIAAVATRVDDRAALRARATRIEDGRGHWLIPGLIDAHAHGYATLLRGTENAMPLELWALFTVLYGRAFTAATLRAAVLLGAAERIRAGITGWIDHSPMQHLADAAIAAHEASGLRVGYAPFLHDTGDETLLGVHLPPDVAGIAGGAPVLDPDAYAVRFAEMAARAAGGSGRVRVLLGPNAPQRCSARAWALWRELRDRHGVAVHTHLMETRAQAEIGARLYPGGLVAAMAQEGLLDGNLSVAHGIWLSRAEREVLAAHGVTLVHNPASNLMLGSGILPLAESRDAGLPVALGTDSSNTGGRHDHFATMRLAMMLPRVADADHRTWPHGADALAMATRNGAGVLDRAGELGRIAPGQLADLVLVRRGAAATLAFDASADALVQHAGPEHVTAAMVDGAWVLRDGRILAFDEAAALADAAEAMAALRTRTLAGRSTLAAAVPRHAASLGFRPA